MDNRKSRAVNRKFKKRTKSFTEALKEKYCVEDEPTFDFIIVSPKRKNDAGAELAHLRTVVLNEMDVCRADIPQTGLVSLCPNVVDLDLANNLFESWSELLNILASLPRVKYVNVSRNRLKLDEFEQLPVSSLSVENLALNNTCSSIQEVVTLSKLMPSLKELHLCGNDYNDLGDLEHSITAGAFSALECLRLNNNGLTSWSEVWKLRHLPQLKYLILSGNPILNIFYHHSDDENTTTTINNSGTDAPANPSNINTTDKETTNLDGSDAMDTSADWNNSAVSAPEHEGGCDVDDVALEVEEEEEDGAGHVAEAEFSLERDVGFGGEDGDDDAEEDDDDDDENDVYDSSMDGRPVSRFGFYQDPQVVSSDESSDAEQDATSGRKSAVLQQPGASTNLASDNINIPQTGTASSMKKVHNINYNNSRNSRSARSCTFDDSSVSSADSVLLPLTPLPGTDADLGEDDPGDWPRLAAEQFLYDLIDQLDLGETTTASSSVTLTTAAPSSFSSSVGMTTTSASSSITAAAAAAAASWYNNNNTTTYPASIGSSSTLAGPRTWLVPPVQHSSSSSVSARVASLFPPTTTTATTTTVSPTSRNTNQNAAFSDEDTQQDFVSRMLLALEGQGEDGSDTEESLFAPVYNDDDFIPRSISIIDDDDNHDSNFSPPCLPSHRLDNLGLSKSTAKRRLFDTAAQATTSVQAGRFSSNSQASSDAFFISNAPSMRFNPSFEVNPSRFLHINHNQIKYNEVSDKTPPVSGNVDLNLAPSERAGQSESDSCSDCEAEQHGVTAALRRELADLASQAVVCSENTPASSSGIKTAQAEITRNANDGSSISTTYMRGGRVVVTGMTNDTECTSDKTASLPSCEDSKDESREDCLQCAEKQGSSSSEVEIVQPESQHLSDQPSGQLPSVDLSDITPGRPVPFHNLQMLCLSSAGLCHWDHLAACTSFPRLHNVRLKNNPLYSSVNSDDKRKLYIASLPKVTILNGSEVTAMEREKAENFYLRYFMDQPEKPELYHTLVAKHGVPVKLVDIDLRAGYQEWATLTFKCEGVPDFTRRVHLKEPASKLRTLVSQVLRLPKRSFLMYHDPCGPSHPESEREVVELRCEALPMTRFDFAEGDEIIVEVPGGIQ